MKDKITLNPNCSEWVGKFNNRKYREYNDDEGEDYDISISTDTFPNGGLNTAIECIRQGFDIGDIEWDNQGGGANGEMLEKDFKFARKIVDNNIELSGEDIDLIDAIIWNDEEKEEKIMKLFNGYGGTPDDFALKLMNMDNAFGKTLLTIDKLKSETKHEITKMLIANRLEGE